MAVNQAHEHVGLLQVRASISAAFGDLQVALLRELSARLQAAGEPASHSLRVEASTDQLEAAVRELRRSLREHDGEPSFEHRSGSPDSAGAPPLKVSKAEDARR